MKRLSAFYKWISSGRVFRLMQKGDQLPEQVCLISQCAKNMIDTFELMKLKAQRKPVSQAAEDLAVNYGFPKAKKHMIRQTIDIFRFLNHSMEENK